MWACNQAIGVAVGALTSGVVGVLAALALDPAAGVAAGALGVYLGAAVGCAVGWRLESVLCADGTRHGRQLSPDGWSENSPSRTTRAPGTQGTLRTAATEPGPRIRRGTGRGPGPRRSPALRSHKERAR